MLTEDQRMQMMCTGLFNCFCTERNLAWSRSRLIAVVNIAGLPVLAAPQVSTTLRYFVAGIGVLLCFFWLFVNQRMRVRINYWQDCLARMEPSETLLSAFRVFTGQDADVIRKLPRIYAINLLPWAFMLIWIFLFVITSLS
jgi:hypothetical protein